MGGAMAGQNFASSFTVAQAPEEVTAAVSDVGRWWTGDVTGSATRVGDEFDYRYEDIHFSRQRVTELVPGRRVVWQVIDSNLPFAEDPAEWTGTEITFEVEPTSKGTEVRFAHVGLVPEFECFDRCSSAWGFYVNASLRHLITTGEGPSVPPWA